MKDRGNVWFKSHKILHLNKLVRDSKQILLPNFTTWQLRVLRSANLIIGNQCPFFHGLAACIVCLDVELNMSTFQRDTISKRIFLRNCFHRFNISAWGQRTFAQDIQNGSIASSMPFEDSIFSISWRNTFMTQIHWFPIHCTCLRLKFRSTWNLELYYIMALIPWEYITSSEWSTWRLSMRSKHSLAK